jgi:hypothetical protein
MSHQRTSPPLGQVFDSYSDFGRAQAGGGFAPTMSQVLGGCLTHRLLGDFRDN